MTCNEDGWNNEVNGGTRYDNYKLQTINYKLNTGVFGFDSIDL